MDKIWKPKGEKSDTLIFIHNECIYKGRPSREVISKFNIESTNNKIPSGFLSIPFSYIHKIINQKGINHIKLMLGKDSEEELFVEDEALKNEIFNYLKNRLSTFTYTSKIPSIFSYARAKIIGMTVLTLVFSLGFYFAIQMESGYEYIAAKGITGIALALGTLGSKKLIIGYVVLLGIIIFTLIKKLKTRSEIQMLKR